MIQYSKVMYVDVGFCAILDEIEQFFGGYMAMAESIIAIVEENDREDWSENTFNLFKEVAASAKMNEFDGDVLFYR